MCVFDDLGTTVLSYCLFPDLFGTDDNIRHRRSVGVSCPTIFRTLITVCKNLF